MEKEKEKEEEEKNKFTLLESHVNDQGTFDPSIIGSATFLDFSRNRKLKIIPEGLGSGVKNLDCSSCPVLTTIPEDLSELLVLDCSFTNIYKLPLLPKLTVLYCIGCRNLSGIPFYKEIKDIIAYECVDLEYLCDWPKIEKLDVSGSNRLTNVMYSWIRLIDLDLSKCPKLVHLYSWYNVKQLICNQNPGITELPTELPNLINLSCVDCKNLKNIPKGYPHIKNIKN